jgi:hypothetical protein
MEENLISDKEKLVEFRDEARRRQKTVTASWNPNNGDNVYISVYMMDATATTAGRAMVSSISS